MGTRREEEGRVGVRGEEEGDGSEKTNLVSDCEIN